MRYNVAINMSFGYKTRSDIADEMLLSGPVLPSRAFPSVQFRFTSE